MESTFAYSYDIWYLLELHCLLVRERCHASLLVRPSSSQAQQSRAAPCHAPHLTLTRIQSCSPLLLRDIFTVFVHGLDIADIHLSNQYDKTRQSCVYLAWQYDMSSGDSVSVYSEQSLGFIKDASNTSSAVYSPHCSHYCNVWPGDRMSKFFLLGAQYIIMFPSEMTRNIQ